MKIFQRFKFLFFLFLVVLTSCNSVEDVQQKPRVVSKEGKQYLVQDSVLITTRDGAKVSAILVRNNAVKTTTCYIVSYHLYS